MTELEEKKKFLEQIEKEIENHKNMIMNLEGELGSLKVMHDKTADLIERMEKNDNN